MVTLEETYGFIPITLPRRMTQLVSKSKVKFPSVRRLDMHVQGTDVDVGGYAVRPQYRYCKICSRTNL